MPNAIYSKNKNAGMTFIEVLIAFVIIASGILGSVAMQAAAKQASFDAMQRSLASSLAEDIVARMRANDPAVLASYVSDEYGDGVFGLPNTRCVSAAAPCNSAQIVANDQYEWELALMGGDVLNNTTPAGGLLNAKGCIALNANTVTVAVVWQGRSEMKDAAKSVCGGASTTRRQVVVQSFIF